MPQPVNNGDKQPIGKDAPTTKYVGSGALAAKKIETGLNEFFGALAMGAAMGGDDVTAVILSSRGPALAEAWAELSQSNAAVRSVLLKLMEGSAWSGVILASLSMLIPIAQAHEYLPQHWPHPFMLREDERLQIVKMQEICQGQSKDE